MPCSRSASSCCSPSPLAPRPPHPALPSPRLQGNRRRALDSAHQHGSRAAVDSRSDRRREHATRVRWDQCMIERFGCSPRYEWSPEYTDTPQRRQAGQSDIEFLSRALAGSSGGVPPHFTWNPGHSPATVAGAENTSRHSTTATVAATPCGFLRSPMMHEHPPREGAPGGIRTPGPLLRRQPL